MESSAPLIRPLLSRAGMRNRTGARAGMRRWPVRALSLLVSAYLAVSLGFALAVVAVLGSAVAAVAYTGAGLYRAAAFACCVVQTRLLGANAGPCGKALRGHALI